MQQQIEADLKAAMLAGDKTKAETLRGLKSALLNEAIAQNSREQGLSDEQIQTVLLREAKKRTEAIELYKKAGAADRAAAEEAEKAVIDAYLPEQASEEDITKAVEDEIATSGASSMADMGKVIGAVKAKLGAGADGSVIARIVREKLQ